MTIEDSYSLDVAKIYNAMRDEYDYLEPPFYCNQYKIYNEHMSEQKIEKIHGVILDLGCGTGIQSLKLSKFNSTVIAIDIATALLEKAKEKCAGRKNIIFVRADAISLPLQEASVDYVSSYGDVISHVLNYERAISELSRVCKDNAIISLEVMNKYYLGIVYVPYELRRAIRQKEGHIRDWEYVYSDGKKVTLKLKTFSFKELINLLKKYDFEPISTMGLHIFSSLVPLNLQYEDSIIGKFVLFLGRIDKLLGRIYPFSRFGFSVIITARRKKRKR